jgi:hypothetical protein
MNKFNSIISGGLSTKNNSIKELGALDEEK